MYLKCSKRRKNGKEHRSWSIVENRRVQGSKCVQRHVLYLGEINDSQQAAWKRASPCSPKARGSRGRSRSFPSDRVGAAGTVPQSSSGSRH